MSNPHETTANEKQSATKTAADGKFGIFSIVAITIAVMLAGYNVYNYLANRPTAEEKIATQEENAKSDKDAKVNAFVDEWDNVMKEQDQKALGFLTETLDAQGLTPTRPPLIEFGLSYMINKIETEDNTGQIVHVMTITNYDTPNDPSFEVYAQEGDDYVLVAENSDILDPTFDPSELVNLLNSY